MGITVHQSFNILSQGSDEVSGVVDGGGDAVPSAFLCTQCTPPASHPWRGVASKVQ